ncbi:hypothetical protein EYF80_038767 [Liparis tanakae]|uniref:Uncharacterized protein n=1 Tax=Liparis tanakae TaxID=230148 RepID=A0A4Z2GBQ9_9TELE|nr:hypothetical protein EYF80_038767 [Liparis tanakae]
MAPSFAADRTASMSGMAPGSRAHPSFHDRSAPFSTTFLALPGPAMNADMSNSRLFTTGAARMCSTRENVLMAPRRSTLCSAAILVRSASRMTVRTVTSSSGPQVNGCAPPPASGAGSASARSSEYTSMEKTVLGDTALSMASSPDATMWCTPLSRSRATPLRTQPSRSQYSQSGSVSFPISVAFAGPGGTLSWNTWPTTAEQSGMPVCAPPFFAEEAGIAAGGPSPTAATAARSSASTEDCMEASSSTGSISTTASCRSGTAPRAAATTIIIIIIIIIFIRGTVLAPLRLQCIAKGRRPAQQVTLNHMQPTPPGDSPGVRRPPRGRLGSQRIQWCLSAVLGDP